MILFAAGNAWAAQSIPMFEKGNSLYEQRQYKEAAAAYETLLKENHGSAAILFNLGNAYFRDGQFGRAILNYLRAAALDPRDPDIQANLRFTRETVRGGLSATPSAIERALGYLTINEWTAMASSLLWIWLGIWALRLWRQNWRGRLKGCWMATGALLVLTSICVAFAWADYSDKTAIVLTDNSSARFGPLEESQIAFTASTGTELRVLGRKGEWVQAADRTGRVAWLRESNLALFP